MVLGEPLASVAAGPAKRPRVPTRMCLPTRSADRPASPPCDSTDPRRGRSGDRGCSAVLERPTDLRGRPFLNDLCQSLDAIAERPLSFAKLETLPKRAPYRRALLARFHYAVVFEVLTDQVVIVALCTPFASRIIGSAARINAGGQWVGPIGPT